ncbi:MAG: hypothetical protein IT463_11055 [Planctomycetes bacterium]|nr:hypothetical protein [Planctomycetota bacterium]
MSSPPAIQENSAFRRWFSRFMYIPAIGGNLIPLVQVEKIISTGRAEDLSVLSILLFTAVLCCWLTYGVLQRDKVLISANIIGVLAWTTELIVVMAYT